MMSRAWRKLQCFFAGHIWANNPLRPNGPWHQNVCLRCGKHGRTMFIPRIK